MNEICALCLHPSDDLSYCLVCGEPFCPECGDYITPRFPVCRECMTDEMVAAALRYN